MTISRWFSGCLFIVMVVARPVCGADGNLVALPGAIGPNDFRISNVGTDGGAGDAFGPTVAYNSTNHQFLVVWHQHDAGESDIYGQRLDATTGAEIGSDFRISDMGPNGNGDYAAGHPAVAYNATNNEYLVAWYGDDNTPPLVDDETEIFGQRLNAATGAAVGTNDFRISNMGVDGNPASGGALYPRVAWNSVNNEYLVIWIGTDAAGETEIWGQRLNASTGAEVGGQAAFSDIGTPGDTNRGPVNHADVAYNATSGEYLVVWAGDDLTIDNEREVFGQRVTASTGAQVGTNDFRISDAGGNSGQDYTAYNVAVAWNALLNEYLVVWNGTDTVGSLNQFEYEIWGQRLSSTGAEVGTNDFRISHAGTDGDLGREALDPDVAYNAAAGEYLVAWRADAGASNNDIEIWAQRVAGSGAEIGSDVRISDMGPDGSTEYGAFSQAIAHTSSGVALIVWQGDDDTGLLVADEFEVFGQLFSTSSTRGDFNGDGKVDLLWRNYGTGAVNVWLMNGISYVSGAALFTVADPNWRIEGTGDFNGDGSTDLIWRHYGTGAVNVWFLSGTTYAGGASLFTVADVNWEIEAVGDFNGDGKDDLIWRHYGTGAVNVWFLDGTTYLGGANLFSVADPNWRIEVVGDFNGDGKNDLVWRNYGSGAVNVWFLNGTTYLSGGSLPTVVGANWDIEAVGDYSGDGKNDLVWRNYGTGEVNVWFLNGTAYLGGANLFTVADANWEIAGPR